MTAVVLKGGVALALLAFGLIAGWMIVSSGPVADRADRPRVPRLVETITVTARTTGPTIEAWGEVVPARRLILRPEVAGRVVDINPNLTVGGVIPEGEVILRIDDRDLRLALSRAEADVREIEARIAIERGQQEIGRRELSRLSRNLTSEQRALVTREPQMAQLVAEFQAAEAAVEQARIALDSAVLTAPYDAIVLSEDVTPGAVLTQGTQAAELVAVDSFNVMLALAPSSLQWLDMDARTAVPLSQRGVWPDDQTRIARIERLGASLSETGRMAEVILSIDDPLAREAQNAGKPRVLLGAFVRAEVPGRTVPDAVEIDRSLVRDNDTVWVMTPEETLEIRKIDIAWRGDTTVLVSGGLVSGDRIVTTPLSTVADGMKLRVRAEESSG